MLFRWILLFLLRIGTKCTLRKRKIVLSFVLISDFLPPRCAHPHHQLFCHLYIWIYVVAQMDNEMHSINTYFYCAPFLVIFIVLQIIKMRKLRCELLGELLLCAWSCRAAPCRVEPCVCTRVT